MAERGRSFDVAVLGAGCTGAVIAYSLARRRILPLVIDTVQGHLPAPASPVASVLDGNTPDMRLAIRSAERLPDLQDAVGPFGYRRTGGMWAALSDADAATGQARADAARAAGLPVAWLSREETLRREPGLSELVAGTVYCGHDGVADASALSRRLLAAAGRFGGAVQLDCGYVVVARQPSGFRITAGHDDVIARRLVVASGALLRALGRSLGVDLPLRIRRRRLCVTERVPPALRHTVGGIRQEPSGAFVLDPPPVIAEGDPKMDVTDEVDALRRIVTAAVRLVPAVEQARLLHAPRWTFVEPADGRPAVGRLDDDLYVAIAADDQAVTLAHVIGETTAEAIAKHRWPEGLEIWGPERFTAAASARTSAWVQDSTQGS
ncbi:MAG TPA: FAD-dependent oxidoreductase [bacterium]|nr:FAD-dependent oxidoreductase [bacterium]